MARHFVPDHRIFDVGRARPQTAQSGPIATARTSKRPDASRSCTTRRFRSATGSKAANRSRGTALPLHVPAFLVAFTTRTSGILQHPELGEIRCKPDKAEFKWSANTRDGVDVSASWIESLDDTVTEFQDILARPSPAQDVALDLDDQLGQYTNPGLPSHVRAFSFVDGITKITSAVSG